jgi:glycosyltransferase involved in cell wall biosynthesis
MDSQDPVFVIPSFIGSRRDLEIFGETLESLVGQSDTRWRAVIVDDDSTFAWTEQDLDGFDPQRMHVVRRSSNTGPGECRNVGVGRAAGAGAPFVLFQDADDLAHPDRLRSARRVFEEEPETDFLYSAFDVIGEHGEPVPRDEISGSVLEIIDSHDNPVEGHAVTFSVTGTPEGAEGHALSETSTETDESGEASRVDVAPDGERKLGLPRLRLALDAHLVAVDHRLLARRGALLHQRGELLITQRQIVLPLKELAHGRVTRVRLDKAVMRHRAIEQQRLRRYHIISR